MLILPSLMCLNWLKEVPLKIAMGLCFFVLFFVLGISSAHAVDNEELNYFLFRIDDSLKSKILTLEDNSIRDLAIPVLFSVSLGDLENTWGDARSGGRIHEGIDILAPRGTIVASPTKAIITNVGRDKIGGNYVVTVNPGGEQFYYAHLDRIPQNVKPGKELWAGDLIGYVGNTGNAIGRSPHLHFTTYYQSMGQNPYFRLTQEFSSEQRGKTLEKILDRSNGSEEDAVYFLQNFLISQNTGSSAKALAKTGATAYFGPLTQKALVEYQSSVGITPASGYFGNITRAQIIKSLGGLSTKLVQNSAIKQ